MEGGNRLLGATSILSVVIPSWENISCMDNCCSRISWSISQQPTDSHYQPFIQFSTEHCPPSHVLGTYITPKTMQSVLLWWNVSGMLKFSNFSGVSHVNIYHFWLVSRPLPCQLISSLPQVGDAAFLFLAPWSATNPTVVASRSGLGQSRMWRGQSRMWRGQSSNYEYIVALSAGAKHTLFACQQLQREHL